MNIFYLHSDQKKCVKLYVDRHVVKMILETCQLLCTVLWMFGQSAPYKKTHENHPCSIWARTNVKNWNWLRKLGISLCHEYTFRYGKQHVCEKILKSLRPPPKLAIGKFFPPPQAMPAKFKRKSTIMAYRVYYAIGKSHLHFWKTRHAWKHRNIPEFITYYRSVLVKT